MRKSIFISLFFISSISFSQVVPGYMGKRFSLGYSNYFMLSGIGPTANATSANGVIGVNTTHCLGIEYTIKNRTNFCLSVESSKTGMNPSPIVIETYDSNNGGYTSQSYDYKRTSYKPMQIQSVNIGLGFKFFQSGSIAPIGKYKKLELLFMFNHLTYDKRAFSYYSYTSQGFINATYGRGDYQFNNFAITYSLGRSRVLFDKLVLDCGIRFGVAPVTVFNFLYVNGFLFDTSSNLTKSAEAHLKYDLNNRIFRYQFFNFHMGLKFLAF